MPKKIDVAAWRRDGERLWNTIQERELVVLPWNNPWFRFAVPGVPLFLAAIVTWFIWWNPFVSGVLALLAAPCLYTAIKYYSIGKRTGGLYSFFSETGFGMGCDADRLSIPYSSLDLPKQVTPSTVNHNYIVLPVRPGIDGIMLERKTGVDSPWDGAPYRRGIAAILRTRDGALHARAYPNEMIVHLFRAVFPLALYLKERARAAEAGATELSKPAE